MKQYYFFLLAVFYSFSAVSQDIRLFQNEWQLSNVILQGEEYPVVYNDELSEVPLLFLSYDDNYSFETIVCNFLTGYIEFSDENTFTVSDGGSSLIFCSLPENNYYEGVYFEFLYTPGSFSYSIEETGEHVTLTLTSSDGNQAIYSGELLSVPEHNKKVMVYPNPAATFINIELHGTFSGNITILDNIGRIYHSTDHNTIPQQLDIQGLGKGNYILQIKTGDILYTQKLIIK